MPASYEVVLVHKDTEEFANEITTAVRTATQTVLLNPNLLSFRCEMSTISPDSHVVVVYVGSRAGCGDSAVTAALEEAVNRQFPVLPIVRQHEPGTVHEKIPTVIQNISAANWDDGSVAAVTELLGMLGLVEQERKVFLSYRRSESTQIASQLHTALVRSRFDVFLDRFALPPGADFQRRLDEELGDKAFVVLLESAHLHESPWVQHEITYAHSHRIDVLAITFPDVSSPQLVPAIDDAFRIRLTQADLTADGHLTAAKLGALLAEIEFTHAKALRRRRDQLLGSLRDKLRMDGCTVVPVTDWGILATASRREPAVFLVTPRRPQPEDFYALHIARRDKTPHVRSNNLAGAIVHDVEHIADERRRVLAWIQECGHLSMKRLMECVLEVETAA